MIEKIYLLIPRVVGITTNAFTLSSGINVESLISVEASRFQEQISIEA